jgi:SAM-dependent methyltransferase
MYERDESRLSSDYGMLCSEVYDLDKPIGQPRNDVGYYLNQLIGVTGRILEPAVGTGRVLIPLLESGLDVEGFDTSPEMLDVCRRHCRERDLHAVLRQADMTTFVQPAAYAAVVIPTGSITLLDGKEATAAALACFHQSLQPAGRVLVDVPPPQLIAEPEPMRHWRAGSFVWTLQTQHIEYDAVANQTTRWLRYEKWGAGVLVASELQLFKLQHWSVSEFEQMLSDAGFTSITVTADYRAGTPPVAGSDVWTFQASRA